MNIPATGKWYMELYVKSIGNGGNYANVGFCNFNKAQGTSGADDFGDAGTHYYEFGLQDHNESGRTLKSSGTTQVFGSNGDFVAGSIMNIAIDMDNKRVFIGKNGTYYLSANPSTPTANSTATWYGWSSDADGQLIFGLHNDYETDVLFGNFGQDSSFAGNKTAQGNQDGNDIGDFYYTPPTGFLALCTSNLPDVAVVPSENFNPVLYTGNGADDRNITGVGFAPNFVWIKSRNTTNDHLLFDSIRGAGNYLRSNETDGTTSIADTLQSFDSDGFQIGTNSRLNGNNDPVVAWNWKANGSGSSNTNGSINSTVSVNTDAGFSIVSYTGTGANATVGHGLSLPPEMILVKRRSGGVKKWTVYHTSLGNTHSLALNETSATYDNANRWNDTTPTNQVFSLGGSDEANSNSGTFIAYAFHSVDGYSKVGSYTGNGNADGPFVYTGFRPAFILIKNMSASGTYWHMADSKRLGRNVVGQYLFANTNEVESNYTEEVLLDITSNGFKLRGLYSHINGNGNTIVYLAFAETPFKYSNAR